MIFTTLMCAALVVLPSQQSDAGDSLLQNAERHELHLHPVADLINPGKVMQSEYTRYNLTFSFPSPMPQSEQSDADGQETEAGYAPVHLVGLVPVRQADGAFPFDSAPDLLEIVRTFMVPPFKDSDSSLKMETHNGLLVLLAYLRPEQEQWLGRFLDFQRRDPVWNGMVKVSILQGDLSSIPYLGPAGGVVILKDQSALEERKRVFQDLGMVEINAPSMTLLPGHKGALSVLHTWNFVKDWTLLSVEPGGQEIADPTIERIQEGLRLNCRIWQVDEKGYALQLGMDFSEVQRPIPTASVTLEGIHGVSANSISMPDLRTISIEADVRLTDGAGVQLFAPSSEAGKDIIILVSFQRTDRPAASLPDD